jgi:hypothetical protein
LGRLFAKTVKAERKSELVRNFAEAHPVLSKKARWFSKNSSSKEKNLPDS